MDEKYSYDDILKAITKLNDNEKNVVIKCCPVNDLQEIMSCEDRVQILVDELREHMILSKAYLDGIIHLRSILQEK